MNKWRLTTPLGSLQQSDSRENSAICTINRLHLSVHYCLLAACINC